MLDLSVIIPAYNEERRLPHTLESVYSYLACRKESFEILVVDDGSIDRTAQVVENFANNHAGIYLISYPANKGKGYAIRTGIFRARGENLLIDDADGSSPIAEIELLESAITYGADLAIGSRAKPDATRIVKALIYRKYMGNTFNLIVQSLLLPGIRDTQCGFKLFKREVARDLFSVSRLNGYTFDVEILFIAKLRNYKISEIAINWTNVAGSKVNVLFDSIKMLFEVFSIAIGAWTGRYDQLSPKSSQSQTKAANAGRDMHRESSSES